MGVSCYKARSDEALRFLPSTSFEHLGAEYFCVAKALHQGRGFADPFHEATGPTAWVAPVLPVFQMLVWRTSGERKPVLVLAMLAIQYVAFYWACMLVLQQARCLGVGAWAYPVVVWGTLASYGEFFLRTHDSGLLLLLSCWIWKEANVDWSTRSSLGIVGWGALGGLSTLASPIMGLVWLCVSAVCCRTSARSMSTNVTGVLPQRYAYDRRSIRTLGTAVLIMACCVAPWVLRNRVVLGAWICIKSNAGYELWQSQVIDGDGVLDSLSNHKHPWATKSQEFFEYKRVGEISFVRDRQREAIESITADPANYLMRFIKRGVAAFLVSSRFFDPDCRHPIAIGLIAALPAMAGLWLIVDGVRRRGPLMSMGILGVGLMPYVLLSYYDRYAAPFVLFKMLLLVYASHSLVSSSPISRTS